MAYRSLLAAFLLPLSACILNAQNDEAPRVERILSVNLDGNQTQGVDVFANRTPDDTTLYASAQLKLGERELWRLPDDFTAFTLDYTIAHTVNTINRHVIVVVGRSDNDYQRTWLVGWDGGEYFNFEMPSHGAPNWNGDNTYTSNEFLGFATVNRNWTLDIPSRSATPIDDSPYPFVGGALQAQVVTSMKLKTEQKGGKTIEVKRGSAIEIEAIDLKGAHETSESPYSITWGDAWLRVRANGKTGWARLIDVNSAINGLPWVLIYLSHQGRKEKRRQDQLVSS